MKRVKSLTFNRFTIKNLAESHRELAERLSQLNFSEEVGFGFKDVHLSDDLISAKILNRNSTYIFDYNPISKEIEKKQIFIYSDISFFIDIKINVLYVLGSLSQVNTLKTIFRNAFGHDYHIEALELDAYGFYTLLSKSSIEIIVEQITINRFNYENGVVGRFSGHVTNQATADNLVHQYKSDIIKLSFKIPSEKDFIVVQAIQNGVIKILTDDENFEFFLDYLKQLIFK